jgi:hypothetical protein
MSAPAKSFPGRNTIVIKMKLTTEQIEVRKAIVEETNQILTSYDRILGGIRRAKGEHKALELFKRFRQTLEQFERSNMPQGWN